MGNFGFVIVGVIALDIFIWVWLIISDKKTLIHYYFLPRTKESLDAEVRNAIVKIDTNNSSHCRYCGALAVDIKVRLNRLISGWLRIRM